MIGAWLMALCVIAAMALAARGWLAWAWHHRRRGERLARIEYARMRREHIDSAESRLPESEFVRYFVDLRPGATRYLVGALLLLLIGLPASYALLTDWPWN